MAAPATVANCGRMKFWPASKICAWDSDSLDSASCSTGTLEALKLENVRRRDARRQQLQDRLRRRGDLRQRGVDVDAGLEEHLHDAVARQRLRFDMLDVVDLRAERALVIVDDASRHVLRRQTVVGPHDRDDRNADVGEDVRRRLDPGRHAEDDDQHRHDDERVRAAEGDADDCEHEWLRARGDSSVGAQGGAGRGRADERTVPPARA